MEMSSKSTKIIISSFWEFNDGDYKSTIILSLDNWDDYGYKTLFNVNYFNHAGTRKHIGYIKIYAKELDDTNSGSRNKHVSNLIQQKNITTLPEGFCSLGQDLDFYENLISELPTEYNSILLRLKDLATNEKLKKEFENREGVITSLFRSSSAEKAYKEALSVLNHKEYHNNMSFTFSYTPPYSDHNTDIFFDFEDKKNYLPSRVNILIGKNGTGKTSLLADLANKLSGMNINKHFKKSIDHESSFSRVISISFSAFDKFKIPKQFNKESNANEKPNSINRNLFSYVYCGLRKEEDLIMTNEDITSILSDAYTQILSKNRIPIWNKAISEILEQDSELIKSAMNSANLNKLKLSSGQMYLLCCITEIISNIQKESLILFDEPELHLHPNAISNLMRMFNTILEAFDSYAIFTTHSPILIQEIPSDHVQLMRRIDKDLIVNHPTIECFGNDLSDITYAIFNVSNTESNYKTILHKLSEIYSYEEITKLFKNRLDITSLMFLHNCCNQKETNK